MPEYITVTAPAVPPGSPAGSKPDPDDPPFRVAIGERDASDPNGSLAYAEHGKVTRVRYSSDVRRSIKRGDLIPCDRNGRPCAVDKANAPTAFDTGPHLGNADIEIASNRGKPPSATADASRHPTATAAEDLDIEGKR